MSGADFVHAQNGPDGAGALVPAAGSGPGTLDLFKDDAVRAVEGVPPAFLTALGVAPAPLTTDAAVHGAWLVEGARALARAVAVSTAVLGAFLEEVYDRGAWAGYAETWAEFCDQLGLDQATASRLRTITRVLMRDCGLDAREIAAVGDQSKLHRVAASTKAALKTAPTLEARDAVKATARRVTREAAALSRGDVGRALQEAGMPVRTGCLEMALVCIKTGERDPYHGCPLCDAGQASGGAATDAATPPDRVVGGVARAAGACGL